MRTLLAILAVAICTPALAGDCHGTKATQSVDRGHGPQVKQSVAVDGDSVVAKESVEMPGVKVTESVEIDGQPGNVIINESVTVGEPGVGGAGAMGGMSPGVHAVKKDARREKRATIAEAKAERKAGRHARKAYAADHEAAEQSAVKKAFDSN